MLGCKPILLKAKAGDLILWDSRTLHGGRVGTTGASGGGVDGAMELARIAVPVCMTPRALASKAVQRSRHQGYRQGNTFNHWPHEARKTNSGAGDTDYSPVSLSERVGELIPLMSVDED